MSNGGAFLSGINATKTFGVDRHALCLKGVFLCVPDSTSHTKCAVLHVFCEMYINLLVCNRLKLRLFVFGGMFEKMHYIRYMMKCIAHWPTRDVALQYRMIMRVHRPSAWRCRHTHCHNVDRKCSLPPRCVRVSAVFVRMCAYTQYASTLIWWW